MVAAGTVHGQGGQGGAHRKKLDGLLRSDVDRHAGGARRVLIRTTPANRDAVRELLAAQGHGVMAELEGGTLTAVVPADALEALAESSGVTGISADAVVRPDGDMRGGRFGTRTRRVGGTIGQTEPVPPAVLRATLGLQESWSGRGVTVAVDRLGGLEMSAEFQGRVKAFYDFTNGQAEPTAVCDDDGHGTHVAGTIAGSGALSANRSEPRARARRPARGLEGARRHRRRLHQRRGAAIDFAVANKKRFGIDVINLSLGHPIYEPASSDPLVQAVERASRAGIIVLASAGNNGVNPTTGQPGYAGINSPGNAPSAITVGAVATSNTVSRRDDRIPDYSSSGPTWYDACQPDLVAPGHRIVAVGAKDSAIYRDYPQLRAGLRHYIRLSGTSMATAAAPAWWP